LNIELPNVVEPKPITRSLERKPQKIAPKPRKKRGKTIRIEPS
jgi:hypothetical protein